MERLITEEAHNRNRKGASKQARAVLVKIGPQSDVFFCFQVNGPITRGEGWGGVVTSCSLRFGLRSSRH